MGGEHGDEHKGGRRQEAVGRRPYDFSQARVRYEERVLERLYPV
ncbi:hypothetical protein [Streptomyces sp. 2P-4]|nr:hypothetical protein [Streptomyces sp. 2P-4]